MRTVDNVIKELDRLDKQYLMLNRVINKISENDELRKIVWDNFEISESDISELARDLIVRTGRIRTKLNEYEVNID